MSQQSTIPLTTTDAVAFLPLAYCGQTIRTYLDANRSTWWILQDVAQPLGYRDAHNAARILDDDEKGTHIVSTLGGIQDILTVNEPGIYHLAISSRRPEGKLFRHWVFHDILPTLRRTGSYTVSTAAPATPLPLTPQGQLPPVPPRVREHAEVSTHLLGVWVLLRDSQEWLSNRELAQRTGIAARTARAHTHYLTALGVIDCQEVFPRHVYRVASRAEELNRGVYLRLNEIADVVRSRLAV